MTDKISIIVPVYNADKYINRCLDSLLNQSYENTEIILVNDGSKDDSAGICEQYKAIDPRIKLIHQINQGQSVARNEALKIATGNYICFVDADDYVSSEYVYKLYKLMQDNNSDISMCDFTYFYDKKLKKDVISNGKNIVKMLSAKDMLLNMHKVKNELYVVVWGKLYKKELFTGIEFPSGRICEDQAVLYKLYDNAKIIAYSDEILYYYFRNNQDSSTFQLKHKFYEDLYAVLEEEIEYMKLKGYEDIIPEIKKTFMFWLLDYYRKLKNATDSKKKKGILKKYRELYRSIRPLIKENMYRSFYYLPEIYIKIKK